MNTHEELKAIILTNIAKNRAELKTVFLNYIANHPGCRRRDLTRWGADRVMSVNALGELIDEGKVISVMHNDLANMDCYDRLYINE